MATATRSGANAANDKSVENMVFGVFTAKTDAEGCYDALITKGFRPSDVNVMMSETTRERLYSGEMSEKGSKAGSKMAEGVGVGGTIGTALGATIAAVAATGFTLALPIGAGLLVAGPIAAALAGGGAGAVTGGLIGGLIGMGMTEQNANKYNEALSNGGVVLSVRTLDTKSAKHAQDLMVEYGGKEVASF